MVQVQSLLSAIAIVAVGMFGLGFHRGHQSELSRTTAVFQSRSLQSVRQQDEECQNKQEQERVKCCTNDQGSRCWDMMKQPPQELNFVVGDDFFSGEQGIRHRAHKTLSWENLGLGSMDTICFSTAVTPSDKTWKCYSEQTMPDNPSTFAELNQCITSNGLYVPLATIETKQRKTVRCCPNNRHEYPTCHVSTDESKWLRFGQPALDVRFFDDQEYKNAVRFVSKTEDDSVAICMTMKETGVDKMICWTDSDCEHPDADGDCEFQWTDNNRKTVKPKGEETQQDQQQQDTASTVSVTS